MVANARRIPGVLLIAAALVAASVTTWATHTYLKRDIDWDSLPPDVCYGLVYLNDLVTPPIRSWVGEDFRPAAWPSTASQAYFRKLVQRAQPYHQPPAKLIDLWTLARGGSYFRRGWPFVTYRSVSIVVIEVSTPGQGVTEHHLFADADGSEPHTNYTAMAGNLGVHFAGWCIFFWLLPRATRFVRNRFHRQVHGFPVIIREDVE